MKRFFILPRNWIPQIRLWQMSGAGTLAYYAPWGDVVMFYDEYSENPSLYELGQAVSGGELVGQLSGTIMIDIVSE